MKNKRVDKDCHPILNSKSELRIEWCSRTGSVRAKKKGDRQWKETSEGLVTSAKYALMYGVHLLDEKVVEN